MTPPGSPKGEDPTEEFDRKLGDVMRCTAMRALAEALKWGRLVFKIQDRKVVYGEYTKGSKGGVDNTSDS